MAKSNNYLNNDDLLEEIYKSIENDKLTRKAVNMLMKLAQKTQGKLYYSCEDDKQNCLSEAYFDLMKRWKKFNPFEVRRSGFEVLEPNDNAKFYKNSSRDSIIKCKILSYPEIYVYDEFISINSLNINIDETKEGALKKGLADWRTVKTLGYPDICTLINKLLLDKTKDNKNLLPYSEDLKSKVLVEYSDNGIKYKEWITKMDIIVKDPNPFSYYTSMCINGFAKGYKELKPKKDKGRFISLDSGFNKEDSTDLFNF